MEQEEEVSEYAANTAKTESKAAKKSHKHSHDPKRRRRGLKGESHKTAAKALGVEPSALSELSEAVRIRLDGFLKVFWYEDPAEGVLAGLVNLLPELGVLTAIAVVCFLLARRLCLFIFRFVHFESRISTSRDQ